MSKNNSFFYIFLYLLPKNIISNLVGKILSVKFSENISIKINKFFVNKFKINMEEAEHGIEYYKCFQDLFIRKLKNNVRKIDIKDEILISPCDGRVANFGMINYGLALQVKGKYYSIFDLLKDEEQAKIFENGHFCTIYLSPKDYHRFHFPLDGVFFKENYIKGQLWPVNDWGVNKINNLFVVNERKIAYLKSKHEKILAMVAVGACLVGKIEFFSKISKPLLVKKADELGCFMFGSTIVLLFEPGLIKNFLVLEGQEIKFGQKLALM